MKAQLSPERKEMINSFIHGLRHTMAMQEPNLDFLKNWLTERLSMLRSITERLEMLNELLKLNSSKIFSVYYLGTIQPFFILIHDYIKNETTISISGPKRSLADIALQFVWEGKIITIQNKDNIAKLFPELKLKNGNKLIQKFYFYSSKSNRVGDLGNDTKNERHLNLMTKTLKFLNENEHIKLAETEINTFKKNVKEVSGQTL